MKAIVIGLHSVKVEVILNFPEKMQVFIVLHVHLVAREVNWSQTNYLSPKWFSCQRTTEEVTSNYHYHLI